MITGFALYGIARQNPKASRPRSGSWRLRRWHWILMLAVCYGPFATAQSPYYRVDTRTDYGVDFAFDLSRMEMNLEDDDGRYPATVKRLAVSFYDNELKGMTYGAIFGSTYLDLAEVPEMNDDTLIGYHFGMALRADIIEQPRLRLGAYYLYQQTETTPDTGRIALDWYEWQINSSLRVPLSSDWGVVMAAAYSGVDADLHISSTPSTRRSLTLEDNLHGEVGLELLFPGDGRASFTLVRGAQTGIRFQFARVF